MATYVKTIAQILEVYNDVDEDYQPIICLTSHSLSHNVDEISTRTRCDANGATQRRAGAYTGEISFDGVYSEVETDMTNFDDVEDYLLALENKDFRITTTYSNDSTKVKYYNGFFSNLEETAELDTDITFTGSLMLNGKPSDTDPNAE